MINPLILRRNGNQYEIIDGERRYKAAKIAKLEEIPAIILNIDDKKSAELAVVANLERENLSVIEEANYFRKILDLEGITQEQLAKKIGKNQSIISNEMKLLNLADEVQEALIKNKISEKHARALLQINNMQEQKKLLEKIISERLNVKATEAEIKRIIDNPKTNSETNQINLQNDITSFLNNNINNDNFYGNDVVSIADLNQKEIEKENDIMNNEQNITVSPTTVTGQTPNPIDNVATPVADNNAPAFGGRFFPSLEDQPTNLNMNNAFPTENTPQPVQPMMENLVDNTPENQVTPLNPAMPQPDIPTFVTNNENVPQPTPDNISDIPSIPDMVVPEPTPQPIMQPESITNTPVPEMIQPQPVQQNPLPPVPEINQEVQQPVMSMPQPIDNNSPATPEIPVAPEIGPAPLAINTPTEPENTPLAPTPQSTDTIAAMNAIKNLALSIQSIGYKTTINEENEPDKYRITIELQK